MAEQIGRYIYDELRDLQAKSRQFMRYGRTTYSAVLDQYVYLLHSEGVPQQTIATELNVSRVQISKRYKRERRRLTGAAHAHAQAAS